jgi:hypothetical protein
MGYMLSCAYHLCSALCFSRSDSIGTDYYVLCVGTAGL